MYVEHVTTEDKDKGTYWCYVSLTVALLPFLPDQVLHLILVLQNKRNKQNPKETNKNF
jgi:hypothetical protein